MIFFKAVCHLLSAAFRKPCITLVNGSSFPAAWLTDICPVRQEDIEIIWFIGCGAEALLTTYKMGNYHLEHSGPNQISFFLDICLLLAFLPKSRVPRYQVNKIEAH